MRKCFYCFASVLCALFFVMFFFHVPVFAEEEGEYLGTLGPGESISTRNIAYGIYQISATGLSEWGGWCPNCFGGNSLTGISGEKVLTTYSVLVDGFSVLDYKSTSAGTGRIDLSTYSNSDAVLSLPKEYTVKQVCTCKGGTYGDGSSKGACGYSMTKTLKVTGSIQLYGYSKKPVVVTNPQSADVGTDKAVSFSVTADKTVGYRWQKSLGGEYTDIQDGSEPNGVIYSGSKSPTLLISNTRCSINGTLFRCILIGEAGDEVASDSASISVTDTSAPKIKVSYTPSDSTTGDVSILISAEDYDSGLSSSPYYFNGGYHSDNSFKVSENGEYEIKVSDNVGNIASTSIKISNIRQKSQEPSKPSPTPTVTVTPIPQATPTPTVVPTASTPIIKPTPTPTPASSTLNSSEKKSDKKEDDNTDKNEKEEKQKKVNIVNYSKKNESTKKDKNEKDYDLNINDENETNAEKESIESEVLLSDGPTENINLEQTEKMGSNMIIALSVSLLLLLLLLLLAMIFPVRISNCDDLGTWHFCALKCIIISQGYSLNLGLLLEDFDSLRLRFGPLFMLLSKGREIKLILDSGESMVIDDISQNMIVDYSQLRRE